MNAQISFIEGQFSLIHIPLHLYSALLQPILRVLLPHGGGTKPNEPEGPLEGLSEDHQQHGFLNISVTPIECSIVCHTSWAQTVFAPIINSLPLHKSKEVQISKDTYIIFSVSSQGMEAGQRVMDLTAPLAMAGIPIFFITTYYTDFILVPSKDRQTVGSALLARGFEFSKEGEYVVPTPTSHSRIPSQNSNYSPPSTPPPSNVAELQIRTFTQLKKKNVVPFVDPCLHLVQCSGKELLHDDDYSRPISSPNGHFTSHSAHSAAHRNTWLENIDAKFYIGLVSALIQQPKFLSITLAEDDAPSLLIDKSLVDLFGNSLVGDTEGCLVPIFLDLEGVPEESTGIVCGVAGRLVQELGLSGGFNGGGINGGVEGLGFGNGLNGGGGGGMGNGESGNGDLTYLSTARAGAVILSREGSVRALEALLPLLEKEG